MKKMGTWITFASYGCEELLKTQVSYMSVMITVLVTVLALLGVLIPIYNNEQLVKFKEKTTAEIDELKGKIEEQRKKLEKEVEEERKALKDEIEKSNQETYKAASMIYLDLCQILYEMSKIKPGLLSYTVNCAIETLDYMLKYDNMVSVESIKETINLISTLANEGAVPDEYHYKSFCVLFRKNIVKNNVSLSFRFINIIKTLHAQRKKAKIEKTAE